MEGDKKIPMLLVFIFGNTAGAAQQGASERLKCWCVAFDAWMAERGSLYTASATKQAFFTWRRLMQERRKMPWELGQEDIEQHAAWMQAQGYAPTTVRNAIGIIGVFYRWCGEQQVDAECAAGFNPAAEVRRPKIPLYERAKLLSQGEMQALLRVLALDNSPLGKRDYAFFLARLRMGMSTKALRELKWGQIEQEGAETWVRWRAEAGRVRLPEDVWEAMRACLAASGRLAGMREDAYVFAPLANPLQTANSLREDTSCKAKDWCEDRPQSSKLFLESLRLYGRLARIPEEKLTLMALARTATRLRLGAGDNLEELRSFLDTQEAAKYTKYRLARLPKLPEETGEHAAGEDPPVRAPNRKATQFKSGDGTVHGLYAQSQPPQAVAAILQENIVGIEAEVIGMRRLGRGLLERQAQAVSSREMARLGDAYTMGAARLAEMIRAERHLAEAKAEPWAEEFLERMDQWAIQNGNAPFSEAVRREALGGKLEMAASDRRLVEEVAATRYVLRNTLALAMEAEDTEEFVRLTEVYNNGCYRLMRLLRAEKGDQDLLTTYLQDVLDKALDQAMKSLGLDE